MASSVLARTLALGGREIPLQVRRNRQARRIVLRIDLVSGGVALTLPGRAGLDEGLALARDRADWILRCLDNLPAHVLFVPDAMVPVLGRDRLVRHEPRARPPVTLDGDTLIVGGAIEHLPRRLNDWLKRLARQETSSRAYPMAEKLGKSIARIAVRDTRSRWGSCSPAGHLSFCWRLVMAPEWVVDYVVAHEVSHLAHLNHGPKFWATVASFGVRVDEARAWLDANAERLQRIG